MIDPKIDLSKVEKMIKKELHFSNREFSMYFGSGWLKLKHQWELSNVLANTLAVKERVLRKKRS